MRTKKRMPRMVAKSKILQLSNDFSEGIYTTGTREEWQRVAEFWQGRACVLADQRSAWMNKLILELLQEQKREI